MRSFVAVCLILALAVSSSYAFDCMYVQSDPDSATVYAVCDLFNTNTTFPSVYVSSTNNNTEFDISLGPNVASCDNTTKVLGTWTNNAGRCTNLTWSEPVVTPLNDDDPTTGLVFTYGNTSTNSSYNVVINLICDPDGIDKKQFDTATYSGKTFTVQVTSKNSCPNQTLSKITYFFNKYRAVFIVLFIVIGLFVCFAGLTMLKYTIFIIGAVGGTIITASLFLSLVSFSAHAWAYWLIFVVCVIIGCVVGWIAVKIETLGFIILGAVLGVVGGLMLFTAVIVPAGGSTVAYWITLVVCGAVGAGLAYKFWKSFVIIATGVLGAFMVIKSIGGIFGNFPSADSLAHGFHPTGIVYAYFAAIIVLAIAGIYVQHKNKKATELEEDSDVHGYQRVMAGHNA